MKLKSICLILIAGMLFSCQSSIHTVDVLIIGGGASGVAAGVQSARMGSSTHLLEETPWLGGMLTAAGVGAIDGNYNLPSGFFGEFIDSLVAHYGSLDALKHGWVSNIQFEPSVGNSILGRIAKHELNLSISHSARVESIEKKENLWNVYYVQKGERKQISAKIIIDATELGDVAKICGLSYQVGMDSRAETKEDLATEIENNIVQDLTYVAILKDYGKDVSILRPEAYDSTVFACSSINSLCTNPKEPERMWSSEMMIDYGKMPNDKYMINWPIEGNDFYVNLIDISEAERKSELKKAKHHTMCFLYFIQKELGYNTLGLADDEYPTDDLLPFIAYYRESRRIDGKVRFSLNDIKEPYFNNLYRTSIAVGDYPVDHHHARYIGSEILPDLHFYPVPSFGLPLGVMIPKNTQDFIVSEKSISVTNLANGTTRLQPVALQIGSVAGILASLATKEGKRIENVSVREIQRQVLTHGGYLLPYLDVNRNDANFKVYQRIGAVGILRAEGRSIGWKNETCLRVNEALYSKDIYLDDLYSSVSMPTKEGELLGTDIYDLLIRILATTEETISEQKQNVLEELKGNNKRITRGEFAISVDFILDPFNAREVDIEGNFK